MSDQGLANLDDVADDDLTPEPFVELARRNAMPDGMTVDEAADVLWLFNDARAYHRLVTERGWMPDRFEQWLADSLLALLIRPDYTPSP